MRGCSLSTDYKPYETKPIRSVRFCLLIFNSVVWWELALSQRLHSSGEKKRMKKLVLALCLLSQIAFSAGLPWAATVPLHQLTGLKLPANWAELAEWKSDFVVPVDELPEFYDWRFYAHGLPKVKRQRYNDCWAQGTVGVLESLVKIHEGIDVEISVQEIISCSGQGTAARGGYFAHGYHQSKGGALEPEFPYVARDVRCKAGIKPSYFLERWGYVGTKGKRPTDAQIKQALMEFGPLGATVTANGTMQRFKGDGVMSGCSQGGTNHIVVIVGWTKHGWIMRNSWGFDWGFEGYAIVPYGCYRLGEQTTFAVLKKVL